MIQKVRLTYSVDVFVKGDSAEQIMEWALERTPTEAYREASRSGHEITEHYDEIVLANVRDESEYDIDLTGR